MECELSTVECDYGKWNLNRGHGMRLWGCGMRIGDRGKLIGDSGM